MLIRMMRIGTHIAAVIVAGAVATGVAFGAESADGDGAPRAALVVDASLARDGRDLVDSRLEDVDAEVRLPRDADEARTNVRYFDGIEGRVTEMDALVAYLQILGELTDIAEPIEPRAQVMTE